MHLPTILRPLSLLVLCSTLTACPPPAPGPGPGPVPGEVVTLASATIESRSGSTVTGTASFEQVGNKVKVVVEISGATAGEHGLHIHEKGDCSDPAAKSAGDHFNPAKSEHGGPEKSSHHAGDFGNMTIAADGKGRLEIELGSISVGQGDTAIVGRAIVFHEKPDDLTTQPSGNSGVRQGCGVITPIKK
jgi:superoxide dismutase, Cu-Zn family